MYNTLLSVQTTFVYLLYTQIIISVTLSSTLVFKFGRIEEEESSW